MRAHVRFSGLATLLLVLMPGENRALAADREQPGMKRESFDADPHWAAQNNRIVPERPRQVKQDYGFDATRGDMGGRVTRATKTGYYAAALPEPRTLNDRLSASGTFALTGTSGGSGAFFGWFRSAQRDGTGRPISSLGLHFDGERQGGRLAVRLLTTSNRGCGKFVTKFGPYRDAADKAIQRPTPIRNDGTKYTWTLTYDPDAAGGNGQIQFVVKSDAPEPAEFEDKLVTVDLPPGYKQEGATFDRFGLMNGTKPGGVMTIHFDDLRFGGAFEDFADDPGWVESGSRAAYDETARVGAHDFGYSPATNHAGGAKAGEIGGDLWRSGPYAYYADRVGPLTLDDRLAARGKVVLVTGAPDSDVYLGWFGGASKDESPHLAGPFVGVHVGGPTRVGHYFQPALTAAPGKRGKVDGGPVMRQGQVYDWTLLYDPAAADGNGAIHVTLGGESVTLPLNPGLKAQGGKFDRFGLFTSNIGGQLIRIYLDDVTYSARATSP